MSELLCTPKKEINNTKNNNNLFQKKRNLLLNAPQKTQAFCSLQNAEKVVLTKSLF